MTSRLLRWFFPPTALAAEAAHELRSSLGAVKNALYYLKEFIQENHLETKDPAVLEVLGHADREIEKAAVIATDWEGRVKPKDDPGPAR